MVIYRGSKNGYNYSEVSSVRGYAMSMHFDKELVNPNISRTIRFTLVLYEWLMQVKEREDVSFNQAVLQCCKNCMKEDQDEERADKSGGNR